VGIVGVALTIIILPESEGRPDTETFDWRGAVLLFLSVSLFFSGMLSFQEGLLSPLYSFMVMALAGVLFFFFLLDQRRPHPLVDGCLFSSRIFTMGVIDSSLSFMAMFSYIFFMPFYLQTVRGVGVLEAGLLMSLYPLITAFLAPVAGALSDKITYRPLTITGLIFSGTGLVSLSFLGSHSSLFLISAIIVLLGIGGALFQSPNNSSVMGAVPRDRLGIAGSLNAFFRNLGMISGTTLAVSLFSFSTRMNIDSVSSGLMNSTLFLRGFRLVVVTAAALAFLGALGEVFGKKKGRSPRSACEERS
jgi:MFS family permease